MPRSLAAALFLLAAATTPALADVAADRAALQLALDDIVSRSALSGARVGLRVERLSDGEVLYARNADDLLNPASNVKLFTTAAALSRLGPGYRFETEFLVDRQPEQKGTNPVRFKTGDIKGPLYVRGKADPSLSLEKLTSLVNELWFAGLRSVSGDLVLDDGYLDDDKVGPGFDQEKSDKGYMAPVGALSLESNAVAVHVAPGDASGAKALVELEPDSGYFVVENRTQTVPERGLRRLFVTSVPKGADQQKIVVAGRVPLGTPPTTVWRKIDQPTFYFGGTLKALLEKRGIKVKGRLKRGTVPKEAQPYLLHQSDTLDLILKKTNKNSSNFMAEQLLKTLGAQATGQPGSWASGIEAIEDFLSREVGLPLGTFVMKNGSGLNDTNRFSATQICRLLRHMQARFPLAPEYLSSLPVAGQDGTIRTRMERTDADGRLRAKTGTLENVSALSGYVVSGSGEPLVFSLMVNDFQGRLGPVINGIDAVGIAVAGFGQPGAPAGAWATAFGPARVAGPLQELKARLATYEAMAKARDSRNLTFLRTALRAEKDPAVRVAIADAILRIAPDESSGARLFLDNFDAGPDVFGRLLQVGKDQGSPTPALGSLFRLAGEGNSDALARVVEVAAQAGSDDALREELVEPLVEIARNASDEMIVALHAAPDPAAQATLELLAKGLSRAQGPHPFTAALTKAEAASDAALAQFAKSLDAGLQARLAAEKQPKDDPSAQKAP